LPERRWAQPRRPHEQVQALGLPDRQPVQHQNLRDNDYAKKYLSLVAVNVVGATGFARQARVVDANGQPDALANAAIEAAHARWAAACDATGRGSLRTLCRTMVITAARDGEILLRFVRGAAAGNPFGLALQLLDVDRLDTQFNRPAGDGLPAVRLGVEIDTYGRPLAYWLRHRHPGDLYDATGAQRADVRTRVPAEDIVHAFQRDRPEQLRGVTWMHAAMGRLHNQGGYEEAALVAARVGASKMGFFTRPPGDDGEEIADSKDAADELYTEVDPGAFGLLPDGYQFQAFNPDYPSAMYADFVKANLRGAASGLNVAYHALANDLEGVNFSSIRSGTLEERDAWQADQEWFIEDVLERIDAEWLPSALAFGQVTLPNGSALPLARLDKFRPHNWVGRRWEWVDPLKDIQADIEALDADLQSPQRVAAKLGRDYEDILAEIKAAQDLRTRLGLPERPLPKPAAPAAATPT
ncbi:MAG: phage portal protein, partial [Burkholderiales bacterium]|nr:phage portal protein [Burkholderiales bacterium]